MTARLPLAALLAAISFHSLAAQNPERLNAPPKEFAEALKLHDEWTQRPSLWKRSVGRWELARTKDPQALPVLIKDYDRPEEPKHEVRFLVAQIAMDAFKGKADQGLLATWRDKHDDETDAWLWFQTMRYTAEDHFGEIRDYVLGKGNIYLKAALLEAMAERIGDTNAPDGLEQLCLTILADLPKKEHERAILTESVARILLAMKSKARRDPWKEVAQALIGQFDDDDAPLRSKVVLSRYFAKLFDTTNLGLSSHWWRNELERKPNTAATAGTTTTVPFFSVRTSGYRFIYVIDASDSMLRRVTDREKKDLGPVTGKPKPEPDDKGEGFVPGADDIDWSRVITRFDVAREYLRLSLESLSDEHEFLVVLFGDEAIPLKATPKLVKATKAKVRAALSELNSIEPGKPVQNRPDGVLRGKTNIHAGLSMAFEMTRSGVTKDAEYIDDKSFTAGSDTIFVLSDGEPSWDDYAEKDARDPDDQAGDPEAGIKFENVPTLIFQGPYAQPPYDWLVGDVQRMNLFRKCEIHCVGIGEANHHLLKRLADIGMGVAENIEGEGR